MPEYIEREFRGYLDYGILARGFARAFCDACGPQDTSTPTTRALDVAEAVWRAATDPSRRCASRPAVPPCHGLDLRWIRSLDGHPPIRPTSRQCYELAEEGARGGRVESQVRSHRPADAVAADTDADHQA